MGPSCTIGFAAMLCVEVRDTNGGGMLMDGTPWRAFVVHHFTRADCMAVWVSAGAGASEKRFGTFDIIYYYNHLHDSILITRRIIT